MAEFKIETRALSLSHSEMMSQSRELRHYGAEVREVMKTLSRYSPFEEMSKKMTGMAEGVEYCSKVQHDLAETLEDIASLIVQCENDLTYM